ncbi:MAG: hypothetical protein U0169_10080 [Polyangiaceae bacterium]
MTPSRLRGSLPVRLARPSSLPFLRFAFPWAMTALLGTATNARAEGPRADAVDPPKDTKARDEGAPTGLEILLMPGVGSGGAESPLVVAPSRLVRADELGSVLAGTASPWSAGFAGNAFLGGRFSRWASVGLRGGLRTASGSAPSDGSENLSRTAWNAGLYARFYFEPWVARVVPKLDPWVAIGVAYTRDLQSYRRPVATNLGPRVTDWSLDHHGVAVPIGVGVDYRVLPRVAVGPSFEYAPVFGVAGCMSLGGGELTAQTICSLGSNVSGAIEARNYGSWTAALDVRLTLF